MIEETSSKVSPLSFAYGISGESNGETKAGKKGPMSEKGKADGKRKDLQGPTGEEQE